MHPYRRPGKIGPGILGFGFQKIVISFFFFFYFGIRHKAAFLKIPPTPLSGLQLALSIFASPRPWLRVTNDWTT